MYLTNPALRVLYASQNRALFPLIWMPDADSPMNSRLFHLAQDIRGPHIRSALPDFPGR